MVGVMVVVEISVVSVVASLKAPELLHLVLGPKVGSLPHNPGAAVVVALQRCRSLPRPSDSASRRAGTAQRSWPPWACVPSVLVLWQLHSALPTQQTAVYSVLVLGQVYSALATPKTAVYSVLVLGQVLVVVLVLVLMRHWLGASDLVRV